MDPFQSSDAAISQLVSVNAICRPPILRCPQEILGRIIDFLPDEDILTIPSVCGAFYHATHPQSMWRDRCKRWLWWKDPQIKVLLTQPRLQNPSESRYDWKSIFVKRVAIDSKISELLDGLINSSVDRIPKYHAIARFEIDAKDYLREQLAMCTEMEDFLSRRYYAVECLNLIHRRQAIGVWKRIAAGEPVKLETALACFGLFITQGGRYDLDYVTNEMDQIFNRFTIETGIDADSPHTHQIKFNELTRFVHGEFSKCSIHDSASLSRQYISIGLRERTLSPWGFSVLICALAERLKIRARPYTFYSGIPHSCVLFEDESKQAQVMDTWGYDISISLLNNSHPSTLFEDEASEKRHMKHLVGRNARSIIESLRDAEHLLQVPQTVDEDDPTLDKLRYPDYDQAMYGAISGIMCCESVSGRTDRLYEHLCRLVAKNFEMDVDILEERARPANPSPGAVNTDDWWIHTTNALRNADHSGPQPMVRRDALTHTIRYRIGTVFMHKRYQNLIAAITGWSPRNDMVVDDYDSRGDDRGRAQPFYNCIVADGTYRYVAEDNIQAIIGVTWAIKPLVRHLSIGKYFRRFDSKTGDFVSNIKAEYPED